MPTSYYDPDDWPTPQRVPQHAATPLGRSRDFRLQARLALRLVVMAGTWAAGLCLVIGLIVLVVSATGPDRIAPVAAASSAEQVSTHGAAGAQFHKTRPVARLQRAGSRRRPGAQPSENTGSVPRLIASFSGRGDQTTRSFVLGSASHWMIQWAYACPDSVGVGLLVVEASPTAVGANISQSGPAGHGDTWMMPGGRRHQLVVISTCAWTMRVMQGQ